MDSAAENAYDLLGLPQGPDATDVEIKKAYRKLALVLHPDKNPDNPKAADEFAALQRAYELLLDADARAALDGLLKARAIRVERSAVHGEKRRRMMEDLERRERTSTQGRSQEEAARAKLQAEIERLRRAAAARQKQAAAAAAPLPPPAAGAAAAPPAPAAATVQQKLARTLKASWARRHGEYDAAQLRSIFSRCGVVDDVVVRDGKRKKGSALVVMATAEGAAAAAGEVHGSLSNPLLVTSLPKAGDGDEDDGGASPLVHPPPARAPPGPATAHPSAPPRAGSALGPKPAAPLFGGAARGSALPSRPSASLFPAGAAAAVGAGPAPARPLFGAVSGAARGSAASTAPPRFSSFSASPPAAVTGGLNREYEDETLARLRQAAERRRAVEAAAAAQQQEQDEG